MLLKLTSLHDISTLQKRRLVYVGETGVVGRLGPDGWFEFPIRSKAAGYEQ